MNRCLLFITFGLLLATNGLAESKSSTSELADLAVREARFFAFQGEWFDALNRLDNGLVRHPKLDNRKTDANYEPDNQVESSRIDFEISYRLYLRDGQTLLSVIENIDNDELRNKLLLRLAKIYLQKGQPKEALLTLDRVSGKISSEIAGDLAFFRGQVLIANGRYGDAISILDDLRKSQTFLGLPGYSQEIRNLIGFTDYNLGVAHLFNNNKDEGYRQLDVAGQISSDDEMTLSIRDKANLMLGELLLADGLYAQSGLILDRVRLDGPFSMQALLAAGWAATLQGHYKQALVPWSLLSERNITDMAVQESMLGVPYSYGKLNAYNTAARLYGKAVDDFGVEIDKLTDSIASIRAGRFLKALVREEVKQDTAWIVKLRELPEMPETYYLLDLMVSHEFQESLNNYLDLNHLQRKLNRWQQDLQVYEEIIEKRRAYYKPLLPGIDAKFRGLDSRMRQRLKQRKSIGQTLISMKKSPRPDLLATTKERTLLKKIDQLDQALQPYHAVKPKSRVKRLHGLISWPIYSSYEQRLLSVNSNFHRLDGPFSTLKEQYNSYTRIRRAATKSYVGYNKPINALRVRIKDALKTTVSALSQQGKLLEEMAETELLKRREKLSEMQTKARFAMAESYDRATTTRSTGRNTQ